MHMPGRITSDFITQLSHQGRDRDPGRVRTGSNGRQVRDKIFQSCGYGFGGIGWDDPARPLGLCQSALDGNHFGYPTFFRKQTSTVGCRKQIAMGKCGKRVACHLNIEEHGFAFALHVNIKSVNAPRKLHIATGDQGFPTILRHGG